MGPDLDPFCLHKSFNINICLDFVRTLFHFVQNFSRALYCLYYKSVYVGSRTSISVGREDTAGRLVWGDGRHGDDGDFLSFHFYHFPEQQQGDTVRGRIELKRGNNYIQYIKILL